MRTPAGKLHKTRALYAASETTIEYSLYLKVLTLYFRGIVELLLKGYVWQMGNYLSSLSIQQVKRKYNKPTVDWGTTKKLRVSGAIATEDLVYFTDQPYWYHFAWHKFECKIPNKTAYKFSATTGYPGASSRKLSKLLQTDPLAHLNFTTSRLKTRGIQDRKQQ